MAKVRDELSKPNYRPVSVLPVLSKFLEEMSSSVVETTLGPDRFTKTQFTQLLHDKSLFFYCEVHRPLTTGASHTLPLSWLACTLPLLSLTASSLFKISLCWGNPVLLSSAVTASGTPKLAETRQRQGQPNWNKLFGKGCPTATKHCSPNGRNLPTGLPSLIRIYYAAMDVLPPGTDQRTRICAEVYSLQVSLELPANEKLLIDVEFGFWKKKKPILSNSTN